MTGRVKLAMVGVALGIGLVVAGGPARTPLTAGFASAQATDLESTCVPAGLVPPHVHSIEIRKAGTRRQVARIEGETTPMPEECRTPYPRVISFKVQFQKRHRWITMRSPYMGFYDFQDRTDFSAADYPSGHEPKRYFYSCTPGKRKTKARGFVVNSIVDPRTNLSRHTSFSGPFPVRVKKAC